MNYEATVINCLTSGYPEGANLPVHFDERPRGRSTPPWRILGTREPRNGPHHAHPQYPATGGRRSFRALPEELKPMTKFEVLGPTDWTFDARGNLPELEISGH